METVIESHPIVTDDSYNQQELFQLSGPIEPIEPIELSDPIEPIEPEVVKVATPNTYNNLALRLANLEACYVNQNNTISGYFYNSSVIIDTTNKHIYEEINCLDTDVQYLHNMLPEVQKSIDEISFTTSMDITEIKKELSGLKDVIDKFEVFCDEQYITSEQLTNRLFSVEHTQSELNYKLNDYMLELDTVVDDIKEDVHKLGHFKQEINYKMNDYSLDFEKRNIVIDGMVSQMEEMSLNISEISYNLKKVTERQLLLYKMFNIRREQDHKFAHEINILKDFNGYTYNTMVTIITILMSTVVVMVVYLMISSYY